MVQAIDKPAMPAPTITTRLFPEVTLLVGHKEHAAAAEVAPAAAICDLLRCLSADHCPARQ